MGSVQGQNVGMNMGTVLGISLGTQDIFEGGLHAGAALGCNVRMTMVPALYVSMLPKDGVGEGMIEDTRDGSKNIRSRLGLDAIAVD